MISKYDQIIDEEVEKQELTFQSHLIMHPVHTDTSFVITFLYIFHSWYLSFIDFA